MGRVIALFDAHAAEWDAEFARVADAFPGRLQCRRGCSMCCSQMFSISFLEAAAIGEAVAALPESDRERLQTAARAYLDAAARLDALDDGEGEPSVAPRPGLRLACPALVNDACSIYEARPIICHKWGIPVFDPSKPERLHACELNFREGESIDAGALVDRQATLLERWVSVKDEARGALQPARRSWTIAEAILAARIEPIV